MTVRRRVAPGSTGPALVQALTVGLFGAVLVRLATGGALAHYVRPGTRPLVLAAGLVLVLAGGAVAAVRTRLVPRSEHGDRRTGAAPASRAAWLLLAPTLTIAVVAPPALGLLTADRAPVAPPRPASGFAALPHGEPVPIALSDVVLRTVWHAGSTLRRRSLRVVGFVAHPAAGGFVLARLVITCCAADARPYDVVVRSAGRPPPAGRWVAVTGRYLGASSAGPVVPELRAGDVRSVPEPADPYG